MKEIDQIKLFPLQPEQAALWFLGQAGYIVKGDGVTLAIDPYLTNSAAEGAPDFQRLFPAWIEPEKLQVDYFLMTHDHLDHLDPQTIARYPHKHDTTFVAPRLAARKLLTLGIAAEKIVRVDAGETRELSGLTITGVFALATSSDVVDTTGYLVQMANGRSFYHASDTAYCSLLLQAAPQAEVLLVPINGKWGNLNPEQALALTKVVNPRYVLPNHYDLMALNAENPDTFRYLCADGKLESACVIAKVGEAFTWGG